MGTNNDLKIARLLGSRISKKDKLSTFWKDVVERQAKAKVFSWDALWDTFRDKLTRDDYVQAIRQLSVLRSQSYSDICTFL